VFLLRKDVARTWLSTSSLLYLALFLESSMPATSLSSTKGAEDHSKEECESCREQFQVPCGNIFSNISICILITFFL